MLFQVYQILPPVSTDFCQITQNSFLQIRRFSLDEPIFYRYNANVFKFIYASVAQSVVQLIRNQQVACSSHVTSSKKR